MSRKIDKSKKSNIKCEHCKYFNGWITSKCLEKNVEVNYWNRCKKFEWNEGLEYVENKEP